MYFVCISRTHGELSDDSWFFQIICLCVASCCFLHASFRCPFSLLFLVSSIFFSDRLFASVSKARKPLFLSRLWPATWICFCPCSVFFVHQSFSCFSFSVSCSIYADDFAVWSIFPSQLTQGAIVVRERCSCHWSLPSNSAKCKAYSFFRWS